MARKPAWLADTRFQSPSPPGAATPASASSTPHLAIVIPVCKLTPLDHRESGGRSSRSALRPRQAAPPHSPSHQRCADPAAGTPCASTTHQPGSTLKPFPAASPRLPHEAHPSRTDPPDPYVSTADVRSSHLAPRTHTFQPEGTTGRGHSSTSPTSRPLRPRGAPQRVKRSSTSSQEKAVPPGRTSLR